MSDEIQVRDLAAFRDTLETLAEVHDDVRIFSKELKSKFSNRTAASDAKLSQLAQRMALIDQRLKGVAAHITQRDAAIDHSNHSEGVSWNPITSGELHPNSTGIPSAVGVEEESSAEITFMEEPRSTYKAVVPNPRIKPTNSGEVLVKITQVISPSHFYALVSSGTVEKFTELSQRLQIVYGEIETRVPLSCSDLSVNAYCALKAIGADGYWHRGQVLELIDNGTARVLLLELGLERTVPVSELFVLNKEFCDLPRRAVICKLAGIVPVGNDRDNSSWSTNAVREFTKMAEERDALTCVMFSSDEPLELYISFQDGTSAQTMNDSLVMQGFARAV